MLAATVCFLVSIAFWPGLSSAAIAPRWAVISVGVPLLLLFVRSPRLTPAHVAGALFLLWVALSLLWTPVTVDGVEALYQITMLAGAFVVGQTLASLDLCYRAMALGLAVSGVLAVLQTLGMGDIPQINAPAGLFLNRNFMGEIAALTLIPMLLSRRWALAAGPATALALSLCRGAWLATAAALTLWLWKRSRPAALALAAAGLALVVTAFYPPAFLAPYGKTQSMEDRKHLTLGTIEGLTWLGHGAGSWYADSPLTMQGADTSKVREDFAHNDTLQLLFEYGPVGAGLLLVVVLYALGSGAETERLVLVAFIVEAQAEFPLHMPATGLLAALVAGRLVGARALAQRDEPLGRGALRSRVVSRSPLGAAHGAAS